MLRIATRTSPLARWQAEHVAALLRAQDPGVEVKLVLTDTMADRRLDIPVADMGGKGVFAKEVQAAVLDGRADLAVHSAKDLPSVPLPPSRSPPSPSGATRAMRSSAARSPRSRPKRASAR